ncbi:MAG: polyprenyl synthetase family protein [Legionellales bacterium]|nr:polyprenyl synthetase family protein [Legionellales bacterium]
MTNFNSIMPAYQQRIEQKLNNFLPIDPLSATALNQAMRYATLGGGKRFRALLVYCCGHAGSITNDDLLDKGACAVELIHAYSLIHDDLPAMDNSHLRRGKPTCHLAFDEAIAILAGDALQALAFELIANQSPLLSAEQTLSMVIELAQACGTRGMAGGQALDLRSGQVGLTLDELIHLHRLKTGALIECSARIGALYSTSLEDSQIQAIKQYAQHLGLAFQIKDDMLDIDGDPELLGKPTGIDNLNEKTTFVNLLTYSGAEQFLLSEIEKGIEALSQANLMYTELLDLGQFVVHRKS